jgi:hypothetical protein
MYRQLSFQTSARLYLTVGAGLGIVPWPLARNVATCMTHTEELVVAVAL